MTITARVPRNGLHGDTGAGPRLTVRAPRPKVNIRCWRTLPLCSARCEYPPPRLLPEVSLKPGPPGLFFGYGVPDTRAPYHILTTGANGGRVTRRQNSTLTGGETMKSCNGCGMRFADDDPNCPGCGSTDATPDQPAKPDGEQKPKKPKKPKAPKTPKAATTA